MRFFLAIDLPAKNQQELIKLQQYVDQYIPNCRFTDPEKFHLTLAFIGNQPDDLQQPLAEMLQNAVQGIEPFTVTPAYLDAFPQIHQPKVIWAGVKGDVDKLFIIRERIKDGLEKLGLMIDERRYTPHIAIAKVKNFKLPIAAEYALQDLSSLDFSPLKITSIKLFDSIPNHGFHRHNTLVEIPLG